MDNNKKNFLMESGSTILTVVVVVLLALLFMKFVAQRTDVEGESMMYTLHDGDALIADKLTYRFSDPKRFDIVIFPYAQDPDSYFIKRIIGLPGETVQIDYDGNIYINGEILEEHYGAEVIQDPGRAAEPVTLGEDEYFVMGDNRNYSFDSREEAVGNIKKSDFIGKTVFRVFPFSSFGFIDKNK
ncbi:signal peptidase I [Butyrivibrio sp. NC2002]|uniref:signal peptidase I n=1 Tax=Butyrivibrio sp. NC2002 TaxID=1410610 RepID=UPI00055EB366|nr:signal peptidase I [Butyrivibrio sp. NC2002]